MFHLRKRISIYGFHNFVCDGNLGVSIYQQQALLLLQKYTMIF